MMMEPLRLQKLLPWLAVAILSAVVSSAGAAERVIIEATEFAFEPETITVSSGEEVTLVMRNEGAVAHNMAIESLDLESATVQSGGQSSLEFTAPDEPGEYPLICSVPGHEQAGMTVTLVVE